MFSARQRYARQMFRAVLFLIEWIDCPDCRHIKGVIELDGITTSDVRPLLFERKLVPKIIQIQSDDVPLATVAGSDLNKPKLTPPWPLWS